MNQKYAYKVRPGYGSKKLLIEFLGDTEGNSFRDALIKVLKKINAQISDIEDLWMNDEKLYHIKSDFGDFELSSDIWGSIFILADGNQKVIKVIDEKLKDDESFHKEEVDFSEFELTNKNGKKSNKAKIVIFTSVIFIFLILYLYLNV